MADRPDGNPDWVYDPETGALYGPVPNNPRLRYPVATSVLPEHGQRIADVMNRPAAPAAGAAEMTEAGELRTRLQYVEHDLEHVARERDEQAAEAARLREVVARVEALAVVGTLQGVPVVPVRDLRRALDGTDG